MPSSATFCMVLQTGLKENLQKKERGGCKTNKGDNVPEQKNCQGKEGEDDKILLDWVPYPSEAMRARVLEKQ